MFIQLFHNSNTILKEWQTNQTKSQVKKLKNGKRGTNVPETLADNKQGVCRCQLLLLFMRCRALSNPIYKTFGITTIRIIEFIQI